MSNFTDHIHELERRWAQALTAAKVDAVIIAAGTPRPYFLDDQSPPYRMNPHFAQWMDGAECPQSLLLVTASGRARLFFHQVEDYWHQPPVQPDLQGAIDIEVHRSQDSLMVAAIAAARRHNRVAFVGETETPADNLPFDDVNPALLLNAIHYGRARKTPYEVECMRLATTTAVRGHRAAAAAFEAGASEYDIHQAYLRESRQTDADLPYSNIVALNAHAGVLHYQHYDREPPARRSSFLIDAGARHKGYAADITRTYASDASSEFAHLIATLDAHQRALIDAICVGMSYVDLHEAAHRRIAEALAEHALVSCSPEAAFANHITDAFLPHGLGHLIGLQTHDVAGHMISAEGGMRPPPRRYPALRLTRAIEAGQVFTIEPGLYFVPMLLRELRKSSTSADVNWSRVDAFMDFGGIRIEDNVLVTEAGTENFTRDAFDAT